MPNQGVVGEIIEDNRYLKELRHSIMWRIPSFLDLSSETHDFYESPRFSFHNTNWFLRIWPDLVQFGGVNLSLFNEGLNKPETLNIRVAIMTSDGIEEKRKEKVVLFKENCSWFKGFCTRSELIKQKQRLMPDDSLTILCSLITFSFADQATASDDDDGGGEWESMLESDSEDEGSVYEDDMFDNYSDEYDEEDENEGTGDDYENEDFGAEAGRYYTRQLIRAENTKRRNETLAKDLGKLLSNSEDSNVIVQVGDVEFKAHRGILMARSPVLSAMFKHDTAEKASNRISICDCKPDVFRQYLQYIYTGSAECLTEENVYDLYRLADKYLAEDLKEQCLMQIIDMLSVQTFCETVKLALTYGGSSLLEHVTAFATKNIPLIKSSKDWQDFAREYPTQADEVLVRFLGE